MHHILTRRDYNNLVICRGIPVSKTPTEAIAAIMKMEYPKTTGAVVNEMAVRGIRTSLKDLHSLMNRRVIAKPNLDEQSGDLLWSPDDIDAAIAAMAELDRLTPQAWCYRFEGVNYGQELAAAAEAGAANGREYVRELIPTGAPNGPAYVVRYREITADDEKVVKAILQTI